MQNHKKPAVIEGLVTRTLDILGDRWTILIVREAFFGAHYYKEFRDNLGIATNILSERLEKLVENDIFQRQKDQNDARRHTYHLTPKGLDLYPITLALMRWGDRYVNENGDIPALTLVHKSCGKTLEPALHCAQCGGDVTALDVEYRRETL